MYRGDYLLCTFCQIGKNMENVDEFYLIDFKSPSPKSECNEYDVVIYGNGSGIDNHRDDAIFCDADNLQHTLETLLTEYGLLDCRPKIKYHCFDQRINRNVYMLVGHINARENQYLRFLYLDTEENIKLTTFISTKKEENT